MLRRPSNPSLTFTFTALAIAAVASLGPISTARAQDAGAASEPAAGPHHPTTPTPTPTAAGNLRANGEAVFNRTCGRCHPNGQEDIGPRLRNRNDTEADTTHTIRAGHGHMNPIRTTGPRGLADADMPALFAYLRSIHAVR